MYIFCFEKRINIVTKAREMEIPEVKNDQRLKVKLTRFHRVCFEDISKNEL